ncbi:hypothetical protein IE81DRAFT_178380 [Ceraceosorus guamensis]|uniref:Uncharacterized protein n=1 Tax=Ceraceosorus guamensis TaxID=1522189 RepID=A0A316VV60_9BASI|nr:hypothetical protein IE81DRAFT_178380 [Ceraceosorus guamensis]PWN41360.1 hypothetical protein IE81DRAFT_178380 [Ceraceosorus guamensis]
MLCKRQPQRPLVQRASLTDNLHTGCIVRGETLTLIISIQHSSIGLFCSDPLRAGARKKARVTNNIMCSHASEPLSAGGSLALLPLTCSLGRLRLPMWPLTVDCPCRHLPLRLGMALSFRSLRRRGGSCGRDGALPCLVAEQSIRLDPVL